MSSSSSQIGKFSIAASATSIGLKRQTNEDRFLIDGPRNWYAIADGIGGLAYGERASECAIRQLAREIDASSSLKPKFSDMVTSCHLAVRQLGMFLSPKVGIGTTLTFLHIVQEEFEKAAYVAHVGDSIAYLYSSKTGLLSKISRDHTSESNSVLVKDFNNELFKSAPKLDRYLGQQFPPDCDIYRFPVNSGDRLILCTDGVTRALDETEITSISVSQPITKEFAKALVYIADIRGGHDNATAIVIDIKDDITHPI